MLEKEIKNIDRYLGIDFKDIFNKLIDVKL